MEVSHSLTFWMLSVLNVPNSVPMRRKISQSDFMIWGIALTKATQTATMISLTALRMVMMFDGLMSSALTCPIMSTKAGNKIGKDTLIESARADITAMTPCTRVWMLSPEASQRTMSVVSWTKLSIIIGKQVKTADIMPWMPDWMTGKS